MSTYGKDQRNFYERNKEARSTYYKQRRAAVCPKKQYYLPLSELSFSSQIKLKKHIKAECELYTDVLIDEKHCIYKLLLDMFSRHPDKDVLTDNISFKLITSCDRSPSFVEEEPLTRTESFRAYYKTDDMKRWKSFSLLKKCVTGKNATTHTTERMMFRKLIQEQINNFRKNVPYRCCKCNYNDLLEVDHKTPFCSLVNDFIEQTGTCDFENSEYNKKWSDFHLEKAELQMLCKNCHYKKTNNII